MDGRHLLLDAEGLRRNVGDLPVVVGVRVSRPRRRRRRGQQEQQEQSRHWQPELGRSRRLWRSRPQDSNRRLAAKSPRMSGARIQSSQLEVEAKPTRVEWRSGRGGERQAEQSGAPAQQREKCGRGGGGKEVCWSACPAAFACPHSAPTQLGTTSTFELPFCRSGSIQSKGGLHQLVVKAHHFQLARNKNELESLHLRLLVSNEFISMMFVAVVKWLYIYFNYVCCSCKVDLYI
jgi:hypothetical protein